RSGIRDDRPEPHASGIQSWRERVRLALSAALPNAGYDKQFERAVAGAIDRRSQPQSIVGATAPRAGDARVRGDCHDAVVRAVCDGRYGEQLVSAAEPE